MYAPVVEKLSVSSDTTSTMATGTWKNQTGHPANKQFSLLFVTRPTIVQNGATVQPGAAELPYKQI